MSKTVSFILSFVFFSYIALAQSSASLSGTVKDQQGNAIKGASITVLNQQSAVVKLTVSDSAGHFEIAGIRDGSYRINFSMVGYDSLTSPVINITSNQPATYNAVLLPNVQQMTGVVVSSRRPFVETKIDRLIINPDALITNAGGNALEVLDKAPGILIDENGSITLKGKAVVVYIDDKPTYMNGTQLLEFLKGQSSATIDKIELMSNPPAKYDAAGNGGVINIRTKKSKVKGFNGSVNVSYTQGKYPRTNNSLNLNYRNNKFNLFGTFSQVLQNGFNDLTINRNYFTNSGAPDYTFDQDTYIRTTSKTLNGKFGADYYITDRTTLGMVLNVNDRNFNGRTTSTSYITDASSSVDSIIKADNRDKGSWTNKSANLNLRHDFKKQGSNLAIDMDYLIYNYGNDQLFKNNSYFGNGNQKHAYDLSGDLPAEIRIASFKTDYSYPIAEGFTMDAGMKASYTETDNLASYFLRYSNVFFPDYSKSNHFLYNETIGAGYINFSKTFSRLTLQAGLRTEHTAAKGHQLGNPEKRDSSFNRNYTNLFPTLYVSYKLDSANVHQLIFSYGRRIDRPVYQDLNPFISPLDQFTNYVGNPLLRPVFNDGIELSHVYKGRITTSLSHYYINDIIQESIEVYGNNYFSKPANIGRANITALSINGTQPITKQWSVNLYSDVQRRHYRGRLYTGVMDESDFFYSFNVTNQFNFKNGWSAELSGYYRSNILVGQIVSGNFWQMNAGVQKKVLNNKGTVRLNVRDIFYTRLNWGFINHLQNAEASYHNEYDTRLTSISFSYNFGKAFQSKAKKAAGGAQDEQNRVRS